MDKKWLVIAAVLVAVGLGLFVAGMTALGWDFTKLNTTKYATNIHEVRDAFSHIDLKLDTADVTFAVAEDGKCKVVCHESEKAKHTVSVKNGTLAIAVKDERVWYEHIGINILSPKVTVFLPAGQYGALSVKGSTGDVVLPKDFCFETVDIAESTGDVTGYASASGAVKIKTSTGNIRVEGISAGTLELSVSTGSITVTDVRCYADAKFSVSTGRTTITHMECKNIMSTGSTGDISLNSTVASERISLKRDTGDVSFHNCDAAEFFVETDTGDVTGTLLSDKVFITRTDTGRIDVPKTITGGRCEITTDTGDIKIAIAD